LRGRGIGLPRRIEEGVEVGLWMVGIKTKQLQLKRNRRLASCVLVTEYVKIWSI